MKHIKKKEWLIERKINAKNLFRLNVPKLHILLFKRQHNFNITCFRIIHSTFILFTNRVSFLKSMKLFLSSKSDLLLCFKWNNIYLFSLKNNYKSQRIINIYLKCSPPYPTKKNHFLGMVDKCEYLLFLIRRKFNIIFVLLHNISLF